MSVVSENEAPAKEAPVVQEPPVRSAASARPVDSAYTDFTADTGEHRFVVPVYVRYLLVILAAFSIGFWVSRKHDRAAVVIASINGEVIDKDVFFHRLQVASGPSVMRQIATEDLQLQFAQKEGVAPTAAQIDARYQEASGRPGFENYLTTHGLSVNDFKRSLQLQLAQVGVATKGIDVTDAEVHRYYLANIDKHNPQAQFYMPETTQVEVIVTRTEAQAAQAYQQLALYVPFDVVARKYSTDSASANGGVLPPLQRGRTKFNNMPGLEDAVFNLQIGEQAGPAKFGGEWWIVRCLNKVPETTLPFSEVKEDCILGAKMQKAMPLRGKEVQAEFVQFQKDSHIQVFWPQYQADLSPQ